MAEVALPDNYQGSDPTLVIVELDEQIANAPNFEFVLYTIPATSIARLRYALIRGRDVAGTMGTISASLEAYPHSGNGVLGLPALHQIAPGDSRTFVWSSEVGDSYSNVSPNFGSIDVMGLPLIYLPPRSFITFETGAIGGGDENWDLQHGELQIELFPTSALSTGPSGPQQNVYLLPQTI